jgi:hypothetical protein
MPPKFTQYDPVVPSIFQRALRADFDRLHPQLQRLFGLTCEDHVACISRGVMDAVQPGPLHVRPFLWLGSVRRIMFADAGADVPFTVENYVYVDRFGRETLTWLRTFHLTRERRFDEAMIFSEKRQCIVVYAGSHQHLAVELSPNVEPDGSLRMRTGAQRLYEWRIGIRFPRFFSADGDIHVWHDDATNQFGVHVEVANRLWGRAFHYRGRFSVEWRPCTPDQIPPQARPIREERRE